MRCTTRSGIYRCDFEAGHAGPCETQAPEYGQTPENARTTSEEILDQIMELQALLDADSDATVAR